MNPKIKRHTHLPRDIVCSVDKMKQQHISRLIREDLKHTGIAPIKMHLMNIHSLFMIHCIRVGFYECYSI